MANNDGNTTFKSWKDNLLLREFQAVKAVTDTTATRPRHTDRNPRRSPRLIYDPTADTLELPHEKPLKSCIGGLNTAACIMRAISGGTVTDGLLRTMQRELRRHLSGKCDCAALCSQRQKERGAA